MKFNYDIEGINRESLVNYLAQEYGVKPITSHGKTVIEVGAGNYILFDNFQEKGSLMTTTKKAGKSLINHLEEKTTARFIEEVKEDLE